MGIFESLENLDVSEECFEDILDIVEEIIDETKKANKEAHQDAIFKKLNPHGEYVMIRRRSNPNNIKNLSNVGRAVLGGKGGVAHTMKDYRQVVYTDSPENAPSYDSETGHKVRSGEAEEVRALLGRDDKFSNSPTEPSKSNKVAKKYLEYKKALKNAKNEMSEACFDEILAITEEIINEVSVNMWKRAAKNSIPSRLKKIKEGPYEPYTEVRDGKSIKKEKPLTYNKEKGEIDETDLIRLRRAQDIVKKFKDSKKSANKLVRGAEKGINKRDWENMEDEIYAADGGDFKGRLRKAELALSTNKKKYKKYRDQEPLEKNPYTPYDSPFYDERKGNHNRDLHELDKYVTRKAKKK